MRIVSSNITKFLNDVQNFNVASGIGIGGEEYEISIGNAAQDISQIIAALMQEMRKMGNQKSFFWCKPVHW